jgi:GMP synthase (glutamine-hydrolysing)
MRIHYLVHAPTEERTVIQDWANSRKYAIKGTRSYAGEPLPSLSEFDFLIIKGGPQSLRELEKFPYLQKEIELVQQAIEQKKHVLGICLGAQIIGEALGAKTVKSPHTEIGVYPIEATAVAADDPLFSNFPSSFDAMHWHYDMASIAPGCVLLAKSAGCPHQAFRYQDHVYALQFHLELTKPLITRMVQNFQKDFPEGEFTKKPTEILTADFSTINDRMYLALDHLVKKIQPIKIPSPTTWEKVAARPDEGA